MIKINLYNNIYKNKNVLVTGHTGFKGSWLSIVLNELGANVIGYSLDPYTKYDNFVLSNLENKIVDIRADIRDKKKLNDVFEKYKPEIVFHLAAQPLVRLSYEAPLETYSTNVIGGLNVLEEFRNSDYTKVCIIVTTDKCYENKEQIWPYREIDRLGGHDPYSSSKAALEIAVNSWRLSFMNKNDFDSHKKSVATVRAGNVIGGGDWSKDRIIPDCIHSFENGIPVEIRSPRAIRPWEFVLEPLNGYLMLAQKMLEQENEYSEAWNFGPKEESFISVKDLVEQLISNYKSGTLVIKESENQPHEANLLKLDITKAQNKLLWQPVLSIEETIKYTVDWYKNYKTEDIYELCCKQIKDFYSKSFIK